VPSRHIRLGPASPYVGVRPAAATAPVPPRLLKPHRPALAIGLSHNARYCQYVERKCDSLPIASLSTSMRGR
jgi:hypothetical protein